VLCLLSQRIQETLGYRLLELLGDAATRAACGPRSALCLPHLRWALDAAGDKNVLDRLVAVEKVRLESLLADRASAGSAAALAHVVGSRSTIAGG
jgi:hypothetical protein